MPGWSAWACSGLVVGATFPAWARLAFIVSLVIVGMGMGPCSLSFILAVQHAVSWGQRGVATGAVIFFRTIGGAIGVGILGGALGWELGHFLNSVGRQRHRRRRRAAAGDASPAFARELVLVQSELGARLRDVYIQMFLLALGTLVCTAWLPGKSARPVSPSRSAADRGTERAGVRCRGPGALSRQPPSPARPARLPWAGSSAVSPGENAHACTSTHAFGRSTVRLG